MLFRLALKNILADYRRSLLTLALTAVVTAFLLIYSSMNEASHKKIIADAVEIYTGYISIQGKGFADNPDYDHLIYDLTAVLQAIRDLETIKKAVPRFETFALFAGPISSVSGMLTGIDPLGEPFVSRIRKGLKEGEFLAATDRNAVYLGKVLAEKLAVEVGDTISYISSGLDYSFTADNVVVKGVFETGLYEFDGMAAFLNKPYMDEIFFSQNAASHIVLLPEDPGAHRQVAVDLREALAGLPVEVRTWEETLAGLVQMMAVDEVFGYLSLGVFLLVVFFVIMLFTLVSIVARTRQIGVMRAIGAGPGRIYGILLTEAFILGLAGVLVGNGIGGWFTWYFERHPIEMPGMEEVMRDWGIAYNYLPFEFSWFYMAICGLFVLLLNLAAVLYPAWRINRLRPVEAMSAL